MTSETRPRFSGRMVAGALLILLGLLFTLDNLGVMDAGDIFQYWPLILIGLGLTKILHRRTGDQRVGGVVLVAIGSFFLLQTLHIGWFRFRHLWPFLLLLVGGALIWQALARKGASPESAPGLNPEGPIPEGASGGPGPARGSSSAALRGGATLNEFAILGGGDRVVRTQDFRGGDVTAILGGFDIDLRGAAIVGEYATIDVFTLWGGVDLKVPEDWQVLMHGVPILGVFTNSTRVYRQADLAGKTLIVKGIAVMGGVEVKN